MKNKVIFLVDMESFYASVEKAERPDLEHHPVIVSGDPERRHGVVLAACPLAKKHGVKNASRLWEAKQQCPHAVIIRPRMQRYIEVSIQITEILERFTDLVEPYSVDEQFLDITGSLKLFGTEREIAKNIQEAIMRETHIRARVGIGPNKMLAKMACGSFAKKNYTGIFELNQTNIQKYMWALPVEELHGIGSRMNKHLRNMAIRTIGDLATFPLSTLKKDGESWGK